MTRIISPLEGEPRTREYLDADGNVTLEVKAKALSPLAARGADVLGAGTALYLAFAFGGAFISDGRATAVDWIIFVGGPLLGMPWMQKKWSDLFKKRVTLRFTGAHFAVGHWGEWETFDRRQRHRFALIEHDEAENERRCHEYKKEQARIKGKAISPKPYYAESFVVYFEYMGQRHDLLEVYGRKEAVAIVTRLQACDEIIEARSRQGRGAVLTPADQWGTQAGDL